MTTKNITITDVGPIQSLDIPVPEDGGVVVLKGRNGSGKTKAIESAFSLTSGDGGLEPRDGCDLGQVNGLGVHLTVRRRGQRRTGELECVHAAGDIDPSLLVDPGVKDADAAEARRIKALVMLLGIQPSAIRPGVGDSVWADAAWEESDACNAMDAVEAAARIKRYYEKLARDHEKAADAFLARVDALLGDTTEDDREAARGGLRDMKELEHDVSQAIREHAAIEALVRNAHQADDQADSARKLLETFRQPDTEATAERVAEAQNESDESLRELQEMRALVDDCERRVAVAESELRAAVKANAEEVRLENSRRQAEKVVESAEHLEKSRPTQQQLEQASNNIRDCKQLASRQQQLHALAAKMATAALAKREHDEAFRAGTEARKLADSCEERLAGVVSRPDLPIFIRAGRLFVRTCKGEVAYSRLSFGERWAIALHLAVQRVGQGGLIAVNQEAWEGLDPENRKTVAEAAKAAGVVILTAEADAGELRAEAFA